MPMCSRYTRRKPDQVPGRHANAGERNGGRRRQIGKCRSARDARRGDPQDPVEQLLEGNSLPMPAGKPLGGQRAPAQPRDARGLAARSNGVRPTYSA